MAYLTLFWWDYLIFFVVISFSITIGIYYGFFNTSKNANTDKQIKNVPIAISFVASTISVLDLLTIPAEIYMHGTQFWIHILSLPIMGVTVSYVYLPVFRQLKLSNTFEYLELRFDKKVRRITFLIFVTFLVIFTPILIYASALAVNQVSGIDVHYVAVVMTTICIFYTTIGGFKAVIWADKLQFAVTLCSMGAALVIGVLWAGGFNNIWRRAEEGDRIEFFQFNPDPTIRSTFWTVLIGNFFHWMTFGVLHPASSQRLLSVPTLKDSKMVLGIFVVSVMIIKSIICFSGLIIYGRYFDCDPSSFGKIRKVDQIVLYYVLDVAKDIPGLGTLFIAGLISLGLSVLSTLLNSTSCTLYENLVGFLVPSRTAAKGKNNAIKIITLLIGTIGLGMVFIVEHLGSLFELTSSLCGTAGIALGVFTLGILFPTANAKGVLYSEIASMVLLIWFMVKTKIYMWNGAIKHEPKPLHIGACNLTFLNETRINQNLSFLNNTITAVTPEEPWWLFKISFHYYYFLSCFVPVILGLLISLFTKTSESPIDPMLLSPVIQRFLQKSTKNTKYESVELRLHCNEQK